MPLRAIFLAMIGLPILSGCLRGTPPPAEADRHYCYEIPNGLAACRERLPTDPPPRR